MSEATELLAAIDDKLGRILLAIETRTVKRPASKRSRMAKAVAEAQEALADQSIPQRVVELWQQCCGAHPQPLQLNVARRQTVRKFWEDMGGDQEVVADYFRAYAADRAISERQRSGWDTGLFYAMRNRLEILERIR